MELGRPSNVGSLVSAVLVGLLALASNHYTQMDPHALTRLIDRIERSLQPPAPPPLPKDSPAAVHKQIDDLEKCLFMLMGKWTAHSLPVDNPQLQKKLAELTELIERLEAHTKLNEALPTSDQTTILRLLFMAAEIDAFHYHDLFLAWSDRALLSDNSVVVSQAAALQFFHAHDLARPNVDQILIGLDDFSRKFPDPDLGVTLYLNIAKELKNKGHVEMSRQVAKRGTEVYAGQAAFSQLINWLIDHKLVTPPSSKTSRAATRARQRAEPAGPTG